MIALQVFESYKGSDTDECNLLIAMRGQERIAMAELH